MAKAKRRVYRVGFTKSAGWFVQLPSGTRSGEHSKKEAVNTGREWARDDWFGCGMPAQLVIRGKNGRIQTEHTYGNDPRRSRG